MALTVALAVGGPAAAATAVRPASHPVGGNITVPETWSTLDPGSPSFTIGTSEAGIEIYDTLFAPTNLAKGQRITDAPPQAELALGATYSNDFKTLTIPLRHGVKFQDGTAFNAAAVKFNLLRDQSSGDVSAPYLAPIASITTPNDYTVVIHLSTPDSNLLSTLEYEPAELMVSPTALAAEGPTQFGLMPVGAGPFKVVSDSPGVTMTLDSWSGYWDAKHRYLNSITYIQAPFVAGDQVELSDLESGAIDEFVEIGGPGTPSVIQSALANPNITSFVSADLGFHFLMLNTYRAPFNNANARLALFYCTNRTTITQYVLDNLSKPAYVLAAPNQLYFPVGGTKPTSSFPMTNFTKGTQLVQSIGGLTVNFPVGTSAASQLVPDALAQQWEQCGIKVNLQPMSPAEETQVRVSGQMEVWLEINGGLPNPYPSASLFGLSSGGSYNQAGVFGYNNATLTSLIDATGYTDNAVALRGIWTRIYALMTKIGAIVPLYSADNYVFYPKTLHGVQVQELNAIFTHAWLS